jgi:hypothetical protein
MIKLLVPPLYLTKFICAYEWGKHLGSETELTSNHSRNKVDTNEGEGRYQKEALVGTKFKDEETCLKANFKSTV